MFKPSILHHRSCHTVCNPFVPDSFGILCWNVYKNNLKHAGFTPYLKYLAAHKKLEFLLFQEANFRDCQHFPLPQFSFDAAANLEFRGEFYGVLTASRVEARDGQAFLSKVRESFIGTHKSLLMNTFPFVDGTQLLILNVHAINFRENQSYDKEIEQFLQRVNRHKGPMIIAGDFNTWSARRMRKLENMRKALSLESVPASLTGKVKSFMGHQLDHVFYRGLHLQESEVLDDHQLSDHHPIYARFIKT